MTSHQIPKKVTKFIYKQHFMMEMEFEKFKCFILAGVIYNYVMKV